MSFSPNNPQLMCTSLKNWRSADLSNCFHGEVKGLCTCSSPPQDYMWKWVNLVYLSAHVHSYALSFLNKHESTTYSTYMLLCVVFRDVLTHMCTCMCVSGFSVFTIMLCPRVSKNWPLRTWRRMRLCLFWRGSSTRIRGTHTKHTLRVFAWKHVFKLT